MPSPVATIVNMTATGDVITGPGALTTMVKGLPVACIGDAVAGPVCTGVISSTLSPTNIAKGRPVASLGCTVTGVTPVGVPVTTVVAVCPNLNEII